MQRHSIHVLAVIVAFALAAAAAPTAHAKMKYNVNFVLGAKNLDQDDWAPVEDQAAFAVWTSFGSDKWPVQIALDSVSSGREDGPLRARTSEFAFGVRKIWDKGKTRPFVSGGFASIFAQQEFAGFTVDDTAGAIWIDGGVFWRLGGRVNIGIEARVSRGEVEFSPGNKAQAGGDHVGFLIGFGSK